MRRRHRGFQLLTLFAAVVVSLAGCFRDTSEVMPAQPVARQVASPTALAEASPVALDEASPAALDEAAPTATETPAPTEQEVDHFALTATALIARLTQPATPAGASLGLAGDERLAEPAPQATGIPLIRATIPPGEDCAHEIRAGETLFQLSLAYGVTVEEIAKASDITDPDRIGVGQQVTIPACGTTGFIPPPTSIPSPTIDPATIPPTSEPAAPELVSADDARDTLVERAQASLLDNAQTEAEIAFSIQSAALPTPGGAYTVRQNDTLFGIAIQLGTTVEVLAALNGIANVDDLSAGTVLKTP